MHYILCGSLNKCVLRKSTYYIYICTTYITYIQHKTQRYKLQLEVTVTIQLQFTITITSYSYNVTSYKFYKLEVGIGATSSAESSGDWVLNGVEVIGEGEARRRSQISHYKRT